MKTLAGLLCALFLLIAPAALKADDARDLGYGSDRDWSITGTVDKVTDGGRLIELYARDRRYTVVADDAKVYEGRDEKRLRDIKKDDQLRVFGRQRDDRVIEARSIYRLGRDDDWYGPQPASVQLYGIVNKVDLGDRRLDVTVDRVKEKVFITNETTIESDRQRVRMEYIHSGDYVRVQGRRERKGEIVAVSIVVQGGRDEHEGDWRRIEVKVTQKAGLFDRSLRVAMLSDDGRRTNREFRMEVPKNIRITRGRDGISVHDIRTGEILNVTGHWDGDKYVAERIEVRYGYDGNRDQDRDRIMTFDGWIDSLNWSGRTITIDTDRGGKYVVYTENARFGGDRRSFGDLRRGDKVRVWGRSSGRYITATTVDVRRDDLPRKGGN